MNGHAILIALVLTGCGPWLKRDNKEQPALPGPTETATAKHALYCDLSRPLVETSAGIFGACDAAGFTSLHAVACPAAGVDLSSFDDKGAPGRMHRAPDQTKCWDHAETAEQNAAAGHKSALSRDHILMRAVAAWVQKDVAWYDRTIAYADKGGGVFCESINTAMRLGRCTLSPSLAGILNAARASLKGVRLTQQSSDALPEDFEAHLRVWYLWLSGQVYGGLTDRQKEMLDGLAAREPSNAVYWAVAKRYADGDMASVFKLLDDLSHWPADRLPGSTEHCTDYLYQRDMLRDGAANGDWLPCTDGETFSGTDYAIAYWMATYP